MDILNSIILLLQLVLIAGQLRLSRKIHDDDIKKEKGYFIIGETNIPHSENEEHIYCNYFILDKSIRFYLTGNSDVILSAFEYSIDGRHCTYGAIRDLLFTLDKRMNILELDFDLKDYTLEKEQLDISLCLQLENLSGYHYSENIQISFKKEGETSNRWFLEKYNMKFDNK